MNTVQRAQQARSAVTTPRRIAVVPVYNEEDTVVQVLDELERLVDQIVVVEDGSTDGSRELIIAWVRHRRSAHTIFFKRNRGLSAAYYAAFKEIAGLVAAGELSADDLIITVDADGQHNPADLERLMRRVTDEGFDAAVARRDLSGYSVLKRTGNNLLTWWASLWAGIRFYDVESGYRVFRAGPLIDALKYYHGYRYSETVEVAVVLPRLGYRVSNDVTVPVPVQRSRTSIRDGIIDALAMIGAWWRVFAGRHKPSDMPALSVKVLPALVLLGLAFAVGDILRTSLFLASDSMHNYAHVWYLSDQIFHHGRLPLHISLLDGGSAVTFPYAIVPYLAGALTYPILGNWSVSLLMGIGVAGTVWAAGLARPVMRDPWMILLFLINPFFIDSVFAFQFATVWCGLFFFLFVSAFERRRTVVAALLLWLTISSHPVIGSLTSGLYLAIYTGLHRERARELLLLVVPVGLALVPVYWMTLSTPAVNEEPTAFVRTTISSIVSRGSWFAAPFVLSWVAPWLRRNYRPALGLGFASSALGVFMLGGFIGFYRAPSGYWGVVHDSSDVYAAFFASPEFQPGMTYRVLEPSEREDGMYRFIRHGAVLSNEFFTESTFHRPWNMEQYACYTAFKRVDFVVVERVWERRLHFNEGDLLSSLVARGQASITYADPGGRFVVYNIQRFVAGQHKPSSLSQCPL